MKKKIIPEILNRKSSVCFSGNEITNTEIEILIEAAKWAPSSRNQQPWKVIFIRRKDDNFVNILGALAEANQKWAKNAYMFAVFCIEDDKKLANKFLDVGFSGQNMMLQAERIGIKSHPMGGWDRDLVKNSIQMPLEHHVVFVLALGKEGDSSVLSEELKVRHKESRSRNDIKNNFSFGTWDFN